MPPLRPWFSVNNARRQERQLFPGLSELVLFAFAGEVFGNLRIFFRSDLSPCARDHLYSYDHVTRIIGRARIITAVSLPVGLDTFRGDYRYGIVTWNITIAVASGQG